MALPSRRQAIALTCTLLAAACSSAHPEPAPPVATAAPPVVLTPDPSAPGNPLAGQQLFTSRGCGGCHTLDGVAGATGVAGPNLTNVVLRPTLDGQTIPMSPANLTAWLLDPHTLKPTAAMPSVGLSQQEAQDLAAYLYSLPYNPGQ